MEQNHKPDQTAKQPKNPLFAAIDKAPFAGKFFLKDIYKDYMTAPNSQKTKHMIGAVAVFGIMSAGHLYQGYMGARATRSHSRQLKAESYSTTTATLLGIDIMYAAMMTAIGIRQAAHIPELINNYRQWKQPHSTLPAPAEQSTIPSQHTKQDQHHTAELITALSVTALGEAIGIGSYIHARHTSRHR